MIEYPYTWYWRKRPTNSWGKPGTRKGQRCRLVARGKMGSGLIEFDDNTRYIASLRGLRKVQAE